MIVQEDVPYTKEEVKAMVKTIHDLREKLSLMGWHPASKPPKEDGEYLVLKVWGSTKDMPFYAKFENGKWSIPQVKWWIVPPRRSEI